MATDWKPLIPGQWKKKTRFNKWCECYLLIAFEVTTGYVNSVNVTNEAWHLHHSQTSSYKEHERKEDGRKKEKWWVKNRESVANEIHTSLQRYNESLPKYNTGQRQRNCAFRVKDRLMDGERKKEKKRKTVMRHRRRQKDSPSWRGSLNGCFPLIL